MFVREGFEILEFVSRFIKRKKKLRTQLEKCQIIRQN